MKAPITYAQAMLHPTVVDTLNALVAIADEQRALVSMLVRELRYIEGISNGQVQRVAKQALAKLPDNAEVSGLSTRPPCYRADFDGEKQ